MQTCRAAALGLALTTCVLVLPHQAVPAEAKADAPVCQPGPPLETGKGIPPTRLLPNQVQGHRASTSLPAGYLHTMGSQIADQSNRPVRLASVGWNQGFEDPRGSMQKIAAAGFNTVRISWVDATLDADLRRIDAIVAAAAGHGIKVILDHHTNEAGTPADGYGAQQQNGLWYDSGPGSNGTNGAGVKGSVTQAIFLKHWQEIAARYAGNSTVIGFDLDNEPLELSGGSTWGDGGATDIRAMYQTVGNAVLAINPAVLIIAEGPQNYHDGMPWGDLSKVRSDPVRLNVADRLVYSVHDYPTYISAASPESGPRKVAAMNRAWGYLVSEHIAPVWIGEMGANLDGSCCHENISNSKAWAATLVAYLNGRLTAEGGPGFSGAEQGVPTNWWAWGNLTGQQLDGTLGPNGELRPAQYAVYSQLRPWPPCAALAHRSTPG